MGRVLGGLGVVLTGAYLATWGWIVSGKWSAIQGLSPNELGDFLGGSFGPLAFLWLVLGFFQQGIELRQNSAALKLQADELAESARQQRELVQATREQLELERGSILYEREQLRLSNLPVFIVSQNWDQPAGNPKRYTHAITNIGRACLYPRMTVATTHKIERAVPSEREWKMDEQGYIQYWVLEDGSHPEADVAISFIDAAGHPGQVELQLRDGSLKVVSPQRS